jgi:hypothetical protein
MPWSPLNFGKYKGKTLPQIVLLDPDWFFWAWETEIFKDKEVYLTEATDIFWKSTHIRVPQQGPEKMVVEYIFSPASLKFDGAKLVSETSPRHAGASKTLRTDDFNLRIPRTNVAYDKSGGTWLIQAFKRYILGSPRTRLTKERCEAFFDDSNNFCL